MNSKVETVIYYKDGTTFKGSWSEAPHWKDCNKILHNLDGPTIVNELGTWWFKNNELHRDGELPAIITNDLFETKEEFWIEGKLSNKIGPAIILREIGEKNADVFDYYLWANEGTIYINEVQNLNEDFTLNSYGQQDSKVTKKLRKINPYIDRFNERYFCNHGYRYRWGTQDAYREEIDEEESEELNERLNFITSQLIKYFEDVNISDENLVIFTLDKKHYVRAAATRYLEKRKT